MMNRCYGGLHWHSGGGWARLWSLGYPRRFFAFPPTYNLTDQANSFVALTIRNDTRSAGTARTRFRRDAAAANSGTANPVYTATAAAAGAAATATATAAAAATATAANA